MRLSPASYLRVLALVLLGAVALSMPAAGLAQTPETPAEPAVRPSVPAVLTGNNVNVRQGPGTAYPIYFTAQVGYPVQVLGRRGQWLEIEFPGGKFSWVKKEYLQKIDETTGIMIGSAVNVRSGPGTQYDVLYKVPVGHKFQVLDVDPITGDWYKVAPMPGDTAWILGDFVKVSGTVPSSTTEVAEPEAGPSPPSATGSEAAPTAAMAPPPPPDAVSEQLAGAEQLLDEEIAKENPADWEFDDIKKMFSDVAAATTNPLEKLRASRRLSQIRAYETIKVRAEAMGTVDEELKAKLSALEQERQAEVTATTAAADTSTYIATGLLEKFYIPGLGGATHKLLDDTRITYLLKSEVVDLKAFEGRNVGLRGTIVSVPGQRVQVVDVTSVTTLTDQ